MMSRPGRDRSARRPPPVAAAPHRLVRDGLSPVDALRSPPLGAYGCDVQYELAPGRLLTVAREPGGHDCLLDADPQPAPGLDVPAGIDEGANAVHFVHEGDCWTVRLEDREREDVPIDEVVALTRALLP